MKKILFLLLFIFSVLVVNGQTPISIYSPNFSNAGGWQINGNASIISSSYLRLTPNTGGQSGSAFWKQKVSLPSNFSFSTYFVSKITPGTRADGMTFCIQQASNTAGSSGGGLGYQGISGKSIAIEYDTYDNGEVGGNNHIALDINGVLHGSTNVISSPVNLADGANKYNWIEYNGTTNILEVRISNTNTRPTNATLSISINLATNFIGVSDVYFGFTAATGGAYEEHDVMLAYVAPSSTPLSSSGNYSQGVASITLSSSNSISCSALSSTITILTKDVNGVGISTTVNMSFDVGNGSLSQTTITTNSSGVGVLTFTSNANTLSSNTIRAEEPNVGAYGTVVITKSGTIPIGGVVSSSTGSSGLLTLSGYSGTIVKWQTSIDNGVNWSDISNTSTSYFYSNQVDGVLYRVVISSGTCTSYSQSGLVTVVFNYSGYVYNSENIGLSNIPVNLYYKNKSQSNYIFYGTFNSDSTGRYVINTTLGYRLYDFRIEISGLSILSPTFIDAKWFNQNVLTQNFNSKDYYRMDTNNNGIMTIADVYSIYSLKNLIVSNWLYNVGYRIFTSPTWSIISASTTNLKSTYSGLQLIDIDNLVPNSNTNFYIIRTGYKQ
jgi:hypothetical protein